MPGGGLGQDGLRNKVSRVLLFSSTDSVTTKPSNILLISRVTSTFRGLGGAGAGDSLNSKLSGPATMYRVSWVIGAAVAPKNAYSTPPGFTSRARWPASAWLVA